MKCLELTVFSLIYFFNLDVKGSPINSDVGYYWRDYTGDIPDDAIPGGVDNRGKTTYIGQTLHNGCQTGVIAAGQIHEAEKKMTYEWGYKEHVAENPVQILCSRHKERYGWMKTNIIDITNLKSEYLVPGGFEKNYTIYIGRVTADGEIAVGKVLLTDISGLTGLFTSINGKYLNVLGSFEVLSYDPSIPPEKRIRATERSPNSSTASFVWQPILIFTVLKTMYYSIN